MISQILFRSIIQQLFNKKQQNSQCMTPQRRALLSKIFNFDFTNSQIPTMIKNATLIHQEFQQKYWAAHPQMKAQRKISISLYDMITTFTSAIITAGFLGLDFMKDKLNGNTIQHEILEMADESIRLSRDPLILLFGNNFLKQGWRKRDRQLLEKNHEISEILRSYIHSYRQKIQDKVQEKSQKPKSIIQLILKEIQKEKENPSGNKDAEISDDDLIDQLKGFVIAATDTTSNYLTNLILFIYEHPHVLQKLRAQIDSVIKSDADITYDNMKKLPYFELVLQESSRVLGASEGGFQRVLDEDASICEMPIFKDICLNVYTRPMLSNPKNFKDPFTFRPQRWEDTSEEGKRQLQLISYQFYGGPRSCIGRQLALTQTKVKVIKFLKRYKSLVEPGVKDRKYAFELTAHLVNSDVILETFE